MVRGSWSLLTSRRSDFGRWRAGVLRGHAALEQVLVEARQDRHDHAQRAGRKLALLCLDERTDPGGVHLVRTEVPDPRREVLLPAARVLLARGVRRLPALEPGLGELGERGREAWVGGDAQPPVHRLGAQQRQPPLGFGLGAKPGLVLGGGTGAVHDRPARPLPPDGAAAPRPPSHGEDATLPSAESRRQPDHADTPRQARPRAVPSLAPALDGATGQAQAPGGFVERNEGWAAVGSQPLELDAEGLDGAPDERLELLLGKDGNPDHGCVCFPRLPGVTALAGGGEDGAALSGRARRSTERPR